MPKGQKNRVEQDEYQKIARQFASFFEEQSKKLNELAAFCAKTPDYGPKVFEAFRSFLEGADSLKKNSRIMCALIAARGKTALDDERKNLDLSYEEAGRPGHTLLSEFISSVDAIDVDDQAAE